ncbi:preprotein translocase subunit YajC [Saccharomonospora viridis]|jgi:preprotein translocase subunit YajC|uniref:Preprotein translocase, YajC subunit n=2 Tax=Saccharomonospora viridis TaxID=1852 RepID=C7MQZ8_SACVD|nr:preprotein translocase subunit YajC [Saccharomonospora viridis]ACU96544.1 preprotein translocase, YajC subunit [Saccharomonospora viridis DSM 43017]KHF42687.1 preprotein translocase subunit YajC [Saccharomonospora viridis]SFO93894.1 preprotein translocase subunit YajC [Saccharomonospora viridis]
MDGLILPLLLMLIVALPLILSTRKQKKLMAEQQEMQNSLTEGDRVMTTSGLYATVADASDDTTIDLEIAEGVVTTWLRQAVRERVHPADADDNDVEALSDPESDSDTAEQTTSAQVAPPLEHGKK